MMKLRTQNIVLKHSVAGFVFLAGLVVSTIIYADVTQEEIVAQTSTALVGISKTDTAGNKSSGTGFIIDQQGSILTNYHVVRKAAKLRVSHFYYKQTYENDDLVVVAVDAIKDIALLRTKNFRGFVPAAGTSISELTDAPKGAPVKLKSGVNESNIIKMGQDVLTLSNPAGLRRIVTKGIVSGIEDAGWLFTKRKPILQNAGYKVVLFDAKVAAGGSGGVVMQANTGQVVGIVAGAVGDDAFSGFGVPVEYINRLVAQASNTPGRLPNKFPWEQQEVANDTYYDATLYSRETSPEDSHRITVSGYVRDQYDGEPISHASVQIFGYEGETIVSQRLAMTDDTGRFQLSIPQINTCMWKGSVEHKYYEPKPLDSFCHIEAFNREYQMALRQDLVQKERAYLEVYPRTVELELGRKTVMLKALALKGTRKDVTKELKWTLVVNLDEKWLDVSKTAGSADGVIGDQVTLEFENDPADENVQNEEAKVYIKPAEDSGESGKWGLVLLKVFANRKSPAFPIIVSGYIETPYGGVPQTERVIVTPYVDEDPISSPQYVDEYGRFEFPIDRQYENSKVWLKVEGLIFEVPDERAASLYVDAKQKWHTTITMKPRD
jgi:S1-C subfamily serine protease